MKISKQDENGINRYFLMKYQIGISIDFLNNLFNSNKNKFQVIQQI